MDDLVNPLLTTTLDISTLLSLDNGSAWVGFTAGTGTAWQAQDIQDWSFSEIPEPTTLSLLAIGGLLLRKRK